MNFKTGRFQIATAIGRLVPFIIGSPAVQLSLHIASSAARLAVNAARRLSLR